MSSKLRVFGADPGLGRFGWAVVEQQATNVTLVEAGRLVTPTRMDEADRLQVLFQKLSQLLKEFHPDRFAIEKLFFSKNVSTAMSVGQARGVALLAAAQARVPVIEYTPTTIKQSVTGYGRADKRQIQHMIKTLLKLQAIPTSDDMADAMAVALCGLQRAPHG